MNLEELGIPYTDLGEQKEIELFWHISQSLASQRYLEEVLQLIVTMTASVMKSKICSLMLLDESKSELTIKATQALSSRYINKPPVKVGESVSGRAVMERRPISVKDVLQDQSYGFPDIAKAEKIASMLSIPMIVGDRVIGVINSYTPEPHEFTDIEIKILQTVANQAALAIENTTLREKLNRVEHTLEEQQLIAKAKDLLVMWDGLKSSDALERIQNTSRENGKSLLETANAIVLAYSGKR